MLMGIAFGAIVGVLLIVSLVVGWQRAFSSSRLALKNPLTSSTPLPTQMPLATHTPTSNMQTTDTALLVRMREPGIWEDVMLVTHGAVRSIVLPSDVDRRTIPVTDGKRVYAYRGNRDQAAENRNLRLVAFSLAGKEEETITDSTPLVEPRGLFVSPNGAFIAFFLDDRDTTKEQKTELWTYDTTARTKRVSVERLSQTDIAGPFFAPDGSFLLRSGEQLLAGSPRRTGVDILPVHMPWANIRWDAGVARSPDGQRIVVVDETGDERTSVQRVVEYALSSSQSRMRFSHAQGAVRILGWNEQEGLLVLADAGERDGIQSTLWMLNGEKKISRPLGSLMSAAVPAGNTSAVGLLTIEGSHATLAVQEAGEVPRRTLTTLSIPEAQPLPERAPLRLVQMVRSAVASATAPPRLSVAPSVFLPYLVAHRRELTDAPLNEPATIERVWVLGTPNAVFMDYRIGSTLWRRLVRLEERDGMIVQAAAIGVYAPVEGEWALARGESVPDAAPIQFYEFEADIQQWIEKPLAQDVLP